MAVTYIAARPITLHNVFYDAGDTVDTTGWSPIIISEMVHLGWLGISTGGSTPLPTATDGQTLSYNATLGSWVAVPPSGNSELAYAENVSGVTQSTGPNSTLDVAGVAISVPASTRPVWLDWFLLLQVTWTTTPTGMIVTQVVETTGGASTVIDQSSWLSLNNGQASGKFYPMNGSHRLGPTASTRTFKLQVNLSTNNATGIVQNNAVFPSYLTAVAR